MRQISMEKNQPSLISKIELIQREIDEIKTREQEFRSTHSDQFATLSDQTEAQGRESGSDEFLSSTNSDDSGISTSSTSINGNTATKEEEMPQSVAAVPKPQPRTTVVAGKPAAKSNVQPALSVKGSTGTSQNRQFVQNQKGIMQRFIASRGKLSAKPQTFSNTASQDFLLVSVPLNFDPPSGQTNIERDQKGRPIRRGYVPVEEKIQQELQDLKVREVELRRSRKELFQTKMIIQYNSDSEDTDPYDPPVGKLKPSKSINELYEAFLTSEKSNSQHNSSEFGERLERKPALSLAQLCDVDPKEAPSSHKLIEKWENLIQSKQHQKSL